jgi:hypothetical protein
MSCESSINEGKDVSEGEARVDHNGVVVEIIFVMQRREVRRGRRGEIFIRRKPGGRPTQC